jgi:hypothetical protein
MVSPVTQERDPTIPQELKDASGPIIVWEYYGYEGWHPKSYHNLKAALSDTRYNSTFVVCKRMDFDVTER